MFSKVALNICVVAVGDFLCFVRPELYVFSVTICGFGVLKAWRLFVCGSEVYNFTCGGCLEFGLFI